jgi:hypothetical protein
MNGLNTAKMLLLPGSSGASAGTEDHTAAGAGRHAAIEYGLVLDEFDATESALRMAGKRGTGGRWHC